MSLRDLIVIAVVAASLPLAFRQPFIGLLVFSWLAYMRPQDLCWGFARSMRLSFFVAITMVVGWFASERGKRPFWRADARTILMLVLLLLTAIGLSMAELFDKYVQRYFFEFIKIIGIALFTTGQVDSKQRLRTIVWTIALCLGFYGFKNGFFGILSGGSVIMRGPGGMLEDNNDFALALVMNVPLLFYLGRSEANPLVRKFCDVTIVFTAITVLLTHSRGAFLALTATAFVIAWRSGKLIQAFGVLGLCVVLFLLFAPDHVIERLASIKQGGEESSAGARLTAWTIALRMIQANPWFGVGMRNFQLHFPRHGEGILPPEGSFAYVAHNSYLQIWAETGTIAFAVYLSLLASMFLATRWIRVRARRRPDLDWAHSYARMMEATTVGFMVGAFFLNRGHFDLVYHWFALMSALLYVFKREFMKVPATAAEPTSRAGPATTAEPRVVVRPAWAAGHGSLPRWERRS